MTVAARRIKRKAARRPEPRTVTYTVDDGLYEGWSAVMKADFPAAVLADLQSGEMDRVIRALDRIVVDHNFPGEDGELASGMAEVDPYDGLLTMASGLFDALASLPNR